MGKKDKNNSKKKIDLIKKCLYKLKIYSKKNIYIYTIFF